VRLKRIEKDAKGAHDKRIVNEDNHLELRAGRQESANDEQQNSNCIWQLTLCPRPKPSLNQ
jgi:hypothetical protein